MIEDTHDARTRRRPAQDLAVLRSRLDHQHGRRASCRSVRLQGPEPRDRSRACTTANHCIGEAARLIEYGDADVMVAGGAEATVSPARRRRLLRRARAVARATTIPQTREPAVGHGPRRLRAGRGRRRPRARGVRAREGARRAHLLRARRLRHERRRAPHHRAVAKTATARARCMAQRAAQRRHATRPRSTTSTRTAPRRRSATSPRCIAVKRAFGEHAQQARGQLDQVDDRAPARRGRRHRGGVHRARDPRPDRAADGQPRQPGSAVRPRLRAAARRAR